MDATAAEILWVASLVAQSFDRGRERLGLRPPKQWFWPVVTVYVIGPVGAMLTVAPLLLLSLGV